MLHIASLYQDLENSLADLSLDKSNMLASRKVLESVLNDGHCYYGINTGFGFLANKKIDADQLEQLQHNLLLSHSVGLGEMIPKNISRLMLQLKIHALGLGYSGVSEAVFDRLLLFAHQDWIPVVPNKGSLGASGDLAPLAHLSLPLLGKGAFWDESFEVFKERVDEKDFRDELKIDKKDLIFNISVSSNQDKNGKKDWKKIGHISFDKSIVSKSCDHRLHFHHPKWRDDLNY